jgi:hypothetical protein
VKPAPKAPFEEVKAASILKLVGTGKAERMGKTKEELVDEYRKARRAELEVMLKSGS